LVLGPHQVFGGLNEACSGSDKTEIYCSKTGEYYVYNTITLELVQLY